MDGCFVGRADEETLLMPTHSLHCCDGGGRCHADGGKNVSVLWPLSAMLGGDLTTLKTSSNPAITPWMIGLPRFCTDVTASTYTALYVLRTSNLIRSLTDFPGRSTPHHVFRFVFRKVTCYPRFFAVPARVFFVYER